MSNKKYRLLKEIQHPIFNVPIGSIIKVKNGLGVWGSADWFKIDMWHLKNKPDWFEEVVEPESPVFVWTDEAVKAYVGTLLGETVQDMNYFKEQWAKKQSKQPFTQAGQEVVEPERIEVTSMYDLNNVYQPQCVRTSFETSAPIPEDKFPAIKQAIEAALNGEVLYSIEDVRKALHGEWGTGNAVGSVVNRLKNYKKQ